MNEAAKAKRGWVEEGLRGLLWSTLGVLLPTALGAYLTWACRRPGNAFITQMLTVYVVVLMLVIFSQTGSRRRTVAAGAAVLTVAIFLTFSLVCQSLPRRGSAYFVLDRSPSMPAEFRDLSSIIGVAAASVPDNLDIGLMVFGGGWVATPCSDVKQLVSPGAKQESLPEMLRLSDQLAKVRISSLGSTGLQEAMVKAVGALPKSNAVQQIIAITSGVESACGPLDRHSLDRVAREAGVKVSVNIFSVGQQTADAQLALTKYATDGEYKGEYRNVLSPLDIPSEVTSVIRPPVGPYGVPYRGP